MKKKRCYAIRMEFYNAQWDTNDPKEEELLTIIYTLIRRYEREYGKD